MPMEQLMVRDAVPKTPEDVCFFAQTNYRNQLRKFGIRLDDRRKHMYLIGKTGMGKTTMMENMILHDIYAGHGVGLVDPHGDFAEKIINYIPSKRINDVVYFNPADVQYPIGFNILEVRNEGQKHLVAAGLMGTFKKIWPDVWSSRMEYILNNTLLALLDYPGSTLLGINRLLADKVYRRKVVRNLTDPVVKAFWQTEFANYPERYMTEAVAPIQNKIGQFLSASVIRNMVAQVKSTINIREVMDKNKIFIMNLSKGRIGEDNSRLLGGMLITGLQIAAMERVDIPENEREDFFLYVDEFQNFANPSFANILSEARKYRLALIMAHQYVTQLDETVADAVFGNVGTIACFRVGGADAEALEKEFAPTFTPEDIVNLPKHHIFLKLMIDGVASLPFSALTMPPIARATDSAEKVIRVSRERYAKSRDVIEDKILRWSGMGETSEEDDDEEEDGGERKPAPIKVEPEKTISLSSLTPRSEVVKKSNPPQAKIQPSPVVKKNNQPHFSGDKPAMKTVSRPPSGPQIFKKEEVVKFNQKKKEDKDDDDSFVSRLENG
ncbi:MAG TPA: type IV secretion system DNA-binding domain-containing protein [Patescibacteria group bacterium]|nr:type IV secretion system DNA-binding domain-containing protein [Patescibacteria group bacterium]